jgi:ABC-2 type transport system ATP-binding protein
MFLTTHYMDEAERCDRIAIIDHGQIVAIDTPDALKASIGADTVTMESADDDALRQALVDTFHLDVETTADGVRFRVADGEGFVPHMFEQLHVGVRSINVRRPSLDDVFMEYTGHELRDADAGAGDQLRANPMVRGFRRT